MIVNNKPLFATAVHTQNTVHREYISRLKIKKEAWQFLQAKGSTMECSRSVLLRNKKAALKF